MVKGRRPLHPVSNLVYIIVSPVGSTGRRPSVLACTAGCRKGNRVCLLASTHSTLLPLSSHHSCGTLLALPCPDGSFCNTAAGQCPTALGGLNTKGGVCKIKPDMCAQNVDPVCGCDGVDYSNECAASLKGVSIAAKGECTKGSALGNLLPGTIGGSPSPVAVAEVKGTSTTDCGGLDSIKCAPEYVCIYQAGNECGAAKGLGKCELAGDMMCTVSFVGRGRWVGVSVLSLSIAPYLTLTYATLPLFLPPRPTSSPSAAAITRPTATPAWPSTKTASMSSTRASARRAGRPPPQEHK